MVSSLVYVQREQAIKREAEQVYDNIGFYFILSLELEFCELW